MPSDPTNFRAFHSMGLWLAVIAIPPPAWWCSTASCTVGVGTRPTSITSQPTEVSPPVTAAANAGPDVRASLPATPACRLPGPVSRLRLSGAHVLVALQAVGEAFAVEALVVRPDDGERRGNIAHQRRQDTRADYGVRHDVPVLGVGELACLVEDRLAHADLADVVQLGPEGDGVHDRLRQPHLAADPRGVVGDPHRVAARVGVLFLEEMDQRLEPFERQLLDAARLLLHAPLQVVPVVL